MDSLTVIYRDYWSKEHRPYRGVLVHVDGKEIDRYQRFLDLFAAAGVTDGDEVVIRVERTGNRPFGDRRVILQRPHHYSLETDEQYRERTSVERTCDTCRHGDDTFPPSSPTMCDACDPQLTRWEPKTSDFETGEKK